MDKINNGKMKAAKAIKEATAEIAEMLLPDWCL